MNSYFRDEKIKNIFIYISVLVLLMIIFIVTYTVVENTTRSNIEVNESEDKTVYNATDELDEQFMIKLKDDNEEKSISILDFKRENNFDAHISEEYLVSFYSNKGYDLKSLTASEIVFEKKKDGELIPNKFYLGVKDNFLAIYKTDENGNPFIESESDVYTGRALEDMAPGAEEELKSFRYYFNTKEEAVEKTSAFTS